MSRTQSTVSPVAVVVLLIRSTMTWWVLRGRPRQFELMWENRRCSILSHLLVPGQCRCLSAANYRGMAAVGA